MGEIGGPDDFNEIAAKQNYTNQLEVVHAGKTNVSTVAADTLKKITGRGVLYSANMFVTDPQTMFIIFLDSEVAADRISWFQIDEALGHYLTPNALRTARGGETSLFELGGYDDTWGYYSIHLKRPLRFYKLVMFQALAANAGTDAGIDLVTLKTE